jgi:TPR repeat protein
MKKRSNLAVLCLLLFLGLSVSVAAGSAGNVMVEKKSSFTALKPVAEGGSAVAQHELGVMYRKGSGVPRDYAKAALWFRKAAMQGVTEAQNNLGGLYATGKGVPRDYVQAHMWFDLAAKQGLREAQDNRERIAREMTPQQIAKAQKRAQAWKQGEK